MRIPWRDEGWSRGLLLGIKPDPNSGYRATVWFEYTRYLFNEIREGSLIAVRNFSDRERRPDGSPNGERTASYEEYSILQVDQVHPWHYAIQGGGEQGYPGFTVAAAESARQDWLDMDDTNRDDVSRIKCEAIPLRLAFRVQSSQDRLPQAFFDRSMPMPGFEVRLLSPQMTEAVLNRDVDANRSFELGRHVVQFDVPIMVQREELSRLHFGVFGYTGAGKSNLISSTIDNLLAGGQQTYDRGNFAFKSIIVDLMDEYTGLLIDHLVRHRYSRIVVCGRRGLSERVLQACIAVANNENNARQLVQEAARDWSQRLILPTELKSQSSLYVSSLANLILDGKVVFYESVRQQGLTFDLSFADLESGIGPNAYQTGREDRNTRIAALRIEIEPLINNARDSEGETRDGFLQQIIDRLGIELNDIQAVNARDSVQKFINKARNQMESRGTLPNGVTINPNSLSYNLNYQPTRQGQYFYPSLTLIIGENEDLIGNFTRQLIERCFEDRRTNSILYPTISFVIDEADVFISQNRQQNEAVSLVNQVTMLARRGRKFGLGVGISTQRVQYLDTSIMAQPHTYFISKLPRKSDRERIAEAFAISDETFEQTFGFTVGQWLITSHDATGLKGVPFPVQLPNANTRVLRWLEEQNGN